MENLNKFGGWSLCLASLVLLASIGKLDLLLVLLPLSALLTLFIGAFNSRKDNPARNGKKGIA
jgi:hypothetical protein